MKEKRVYIIDCSKSEIDFRAKEQVGDYEAIMTEAERLGTVYSLDYFVSEVNDENINLNNSFIYIN